MQNSKEISDELMGISPHIAALDKTNVFAIPANYFDELHLRLTDYTILNINPAADGNVKGNLHRVPDGYFNSLSDSILAKVKATYEEPTEEEVSHLLNGLKNVNVVQAPVGYFDTLSVSVIEKIKIEEDRNAGSELRAISPLLYSIKDENVFTVPSGYFESFLDRVVEKINHKPAKIITMKRPGSWLKYAAAAVVAGIISVVSLQFFNNSHTSEDAGLPEYVKSSFQYKTPDELNAGIAKLSDDDIVKYLEKNGSAMDNEVLIHNTDVSEMPGTTDYLDDANALNKYLDKIDAQNTGKLTP